MINHLRHMAVFARVVDEGSFRAAAKALELAPSRVSQTVSDLESYLGITLLYRSTRKLQLTGEGRRFYQHVHNLVRSAEAGLDELNARAQEVSGELKISLPAFLSSSRISTAIAEFACTNPKVNLSLTYSDQVMDFFEEGLDLRIRVGWLEDSSMLSRKLTESRRLLVAGKAYLESKQKIKHPHELKYLDWIGFHSRANKTEFSLSDGQRVSVAENARVSANSAEAVCHLALQGLGLTILPEHLVATAIESGELIHVLPEWQVKPLGYYAVWPDKSRRENLTLNLVRYLADKNL